MRTTLSSLALPALVALVASAPACGSEDQGQGVSDVRPDATSLLDVSFVDILTPPDATAGTDAATDAAAADATACQTYGCACTSNAGCLDGLCIEGPDGYFCTKNCITDCPDGLDCITTTGLGPDPVSLCAPRHVRLCRPCRADAECATPLAVNPGHCLPAADPDAGRFCGTSCEGGLPCPEGYACATVTLDNGVSAKQCQPISGLCECRDAWADDAYATTCAITNAIGRCPGSRACGPAGLTSCEGPIPAREVCNERDDDCDGITDDIASAACTVDNDLGQCPGVTACAGPDTVCDGPTPAAEVCNDHDDDCDGKTDEGTCDDDLDCTVDTCDPTRGGDGCAHDLAPGTCLIAGACFEAAAPMPGDPCQACLPAESATDWSDASGTPCDDGDLCTWNDTCAAGACGGQRYVCNDGVACTVDRCDGEGGCGATQAAGTCFIDNACVADGALEAPGSCLACDAALSPKAWSPRDGASCDDHDACTQDDACDGAACVGASYSCDDDDACTTDVCDGHGGCGHAQVATSCVIGGVCYAAGFLKPGEPCYVCDPEKSLTTWSTSAPGSACDDGQACTHADKCLAGACAGTPYACNDGIACTVDGCDGQGGCTATLDGTACLIAGACVAAGAREAPGSCMACDPVRSPKAWYPKDGASCDDHAACTQRDTCQGATCVGEAYACDDQNACTIDTCNGDGTCSSVQATTSCIIGGQCYAADVAKPGEPCLACRPTISTSQWSPVAPDTACDDGLACTKRDTCSAGACSGTAYTCNDGLACTTDACDGAGGCGATTADNACVIDGACRASGARKTAGGCLACDPTQSQTAWSPIDGASCDDGVACTKADTCNGASCGGVAYTCDDGVACTDDACDGDGTCTFLRIGGTCLINGQCWADGAQKPGEPCYACRPEVSGTTWSPTAGAVACDDGNKCTQHDTCASGVCAGASYACDDGLACTADACDGAGGCTATVLDGSCRIAGPQGARCVAAGTLAAAGGCLVCDPTRDRGDWSPNAGASCNDGVACTKEDTCVGAICLGTTYGCDDGASCTADRCNGDGTCGHDLASGWCLIGGACFADGAPQPGEGCRACRPTIATGVFSAVQDGTACSDGQLCTAGDACAAGSCLGTPYTCNDGLACTVDTCKGDGGCQATISAGACLIAGTCYASGETRGSGASACLVCEPELSQQGWYPNDGAACDDGNACSKLDTCAGSACGGTAYSCDDSNACTIDSCKGDGTCGHVQATNTCIIDGTCYAAGTPKPGEPCLACRPDVSASTWSAVAPGAPCNDGNACTKSDVCNGGACGGTAYACNDGLACTSDACDGAGGCVATVNGGSCAIEGACYANGALKTAGGCLVCAASASPTAWYPNSGAACNDGNACTKSDTCAGSTCAGAGYSCDDALACTADSCNGDGTCGHALAASTCLIAGVCYAAGTTKSGEPCLQCRPDVSTATWSPVQGTVGCNDGNACTKSDTCSGGTCVGTLYSCGDMLACTSDTCNGDGTCAYTPTTGNCAINGACYANGAVDPTNPCKVCNAAANPTGWSNKSPGTTCSDGNACTKSDVCSATGTCAGTAYSCSDGLLCTGDVCDGGGGCTNPVTNGCAIGGQCISSGAYNPSNPCQQCVPGTSTTAWTANSGNVCNDGNACTYNDKCASGACGGTAYGCNDNLACTTDTCNGSGGCANALNSGYCNISNACIANGATQTGNICYKCNTVSSTTAWSYNDGASCNDGDGCSDGDTCGSGVCDGVDRGDAYEPNQSITQQSHLTNITDCASLNEHSLSATLYGPGDVDWYYFGESDSFGCDFYPHVSLTNVPAAADFDLYVYFECWDGSTASMGCGAGSSYAVSADGYPGCASRAGGSASETVVLDPDCASVDDGGWVDIEVVRWSGSSTCNQAYTLTWGDD